MASDAVAVRIEIKELQNLQLPRSFTLRSGDKYVKVQVSSSVEGSERTTQPIRFPAEDGGSRTLTGQGVLFSKLDNPGDQLQVSAYKCDQAGGDEELIGTAEVGHTRGQVVDLKLKHKGKDQGAVKITVTNAFDTTSPGTGRSAGNVAASLPQADVPPRFCKDHDESSKRVKTVPRKQACTACNVEVQMNYESFVYCPPCSEAKALCMICGKDAPRAGNYVPSKVPPPASEPQRPPPSTPATRPENQTSTRGSPSQAPPPRSAVRPADQVALRVLRNRSPNNPDRGKCDVTIEEIDKSGLERFKNPHIVMSLEKQEERVYFQDFPSSSSFSFYTLQSSLILYLYEEGRPDPLGHAFVPLSEVIWPTGKPPTLERVCAVLQQPKQEVKKRVVVPFLPALRGDGTKQTKQGDAFEDKLVPGCLDSNGPNPYKQHRVTGEAPTFGWITLTIQIVTLNEAQVVSVRTNLQKAVTDGATFAWANQEFDKNELFTSGCVNGYLPQESAAAHRSGPGQGFLNPRDRSVAPTPQEYADELADEELRSLLVSLLRLRRFFAGHYGFSLAVRWMRAAKWRGMVVAGGWMLFCNTGYFPPPLWLAPFYFWLALLVVGLLAMRARVANQRDLGQRALSDLEDPNKVVIDKRGIAEAVRELEPIVRGLASGLERLRNLLTFADGAASVAFFAVIGSSCLAMMVSFFIITCFESVGFIFGLYVAIPLILFVVRMPTPAGASVNPLDQPLLNVIDEPPKFGFLRRLGMSLAFAVPDEVELNHRAIASKLTRSEAMEGQRVESPEIVNFGEGLTLTVTRPGDQKTFPRPGQHFVVIHYEGRFSRTGEMFDSSRRNKGDPITVPVGDNKVIRGWEIAIPKMSLGQRGVLHVPSHLGYGPDGHPPHIPPFADLDFDIEVVSIEPRRR